MSGNFVQGAMRNALSIQADPSRALSGAGRSFAEGGNLALKLTSLIDAEEKQRQDYTNQLEQNILQGERQLEVKRHNLQAESLAKDELKLNRDKYNLDVTKFNSALDLKDGEASVQPVSDVYETTKSDPKDIANAEIKLQLDSEKFNLDLAKHDQAQKDLSRLGLLDPNDPSSAGLISSMEQEKLSLEKRAKQLEKDTLKINDMQTMIKKPKTLSQYKEDTNAKMLSIDNDKTLTKSEKIGQKLRLRKELDAKIAIAQGNIDAKVKLENEINKENRTLANNIILETEKTKNQATLDMAKIKQTEAYKAMSKMKQQAFESYLSDKTSGLWDYFMSDQAEILKDFEETYKGK